MFENLTNKLGNVFNALKKRGALTEKDVDEALKDVRVALLEADVSLEVVNDFIIKVRERAVGYIYDKKLVHSLFEKAKERYGERNGGYTRIVRTVSRKGDNAQMAIIELV